MKRLLITLATALIVAFPVLSQENVPGKKYVGIFYFVWLGQHPAQQDGIYDITKLLKESPDDLWNVEGTPKSPAQKYHFWGEPLYGYYDSSDPWVVTRHVELLMNAGIDYLMMDTTNAVWYPESIGALLDALKKFADQGFDVPKVAFFTNTMSGYTVQNIYDTFFKSGKWDGLFFCPNGKPLVIGLTEKNKSSDQPKDGFVSQELQDFFDVHESQWPNAPLDHDAYPWMSWDYPQHIHNGGVISVSVSQHSVKTVSFSDTLGCQGRGYDPILKENIHAEKRSGHNFQSQWNTALQNKDKVNNVFVTGWNEWIALKLRSRDKTVFVDLFNEEFSRDAEMMKGGYGDNFYMLLAENVCKFKGDCGIAAEHGNVYRDPEGDAMIRDYKNFDGSARYQDNSARNDIVEVSVSDDATSIIFTVKTASDVIPYAQGDKNWMNILIKTSDSRDRAFEYDYLINRYPTVNGVTTVERIAPDGCKTISGKADYSVSGNILKVTVPLSSLGLEKGNVHFQFKVADNVTHPDDIMDYYISGDSAPLGRMSFSY